MSRGLFGLGLPTLWVRSNSVRVRFDPIFLDKPRTRSSVFSSLFSLIPEIRTRFRLEYCSWSSSFISRRFNLAFNSVFSLHSFVFSSSSNSNFEVNLEMTLVTMEGNIRQSIHVAKWQLHIAKWQLHTAKWQLHFALFYLLQNNCVFLASLCLYQLVKYCLHTSF